MLVQQRKDRTEAALVFNTSGLTSRTLSDLDIPIKKRSSSQVNFITGLGVFIGFVGPIFASIIGGNVNSGAISSTVGWVMVSLAALGCTMGLPKSIQIWRNFKFNRAWKAVEMDRASGVTLSYYSDSSNSYSFNILLKSPFGQHLTRILKDEIKVKGIGDREQMASYAEYLDKNPEGRPFPKIAPHLYEFLSATSELDQLQLRTSASASSTLIGSFEEQATRLVDTFVDLMQKVTTSHEEQLGFQLQKSIETASSQIYNNFDKVAIPALQ